MPTNTFQAAHYQDAVLVSDKPEDYSEIDMVGTMDGLKLFIGGFHEQHFIRMLEKVRDDKSDLFNCGEVFLAEDILRQL